MNAVFNRPGVVIVDEALPLAVPTGKRRAKYRQCKCVDGCTGSLSLWQTERLSKVVVTEHFLYFFHGSIEFQWFGHVGFFQVMMNKQMNA